MTIGHAEFQTKSSELPALGVNATSDICLARVNKDAFGKLHSFEIRNKGKGNVHFKLKKRGLETNIPAENIDSLRVGASDWFRGTFANRRIKPKSVVIVDSNATIPQRVEDTNGDGILWQTDGPAGITYPKKVGEVEYNEAKINFTFEMAVTTSVTVGYKHSDWSEFATPIEFDPIVAGGACHTFIILPDNAQNFYDEIRDEEEIGFFAALKATTPPQPETILGMTIYYMGDDSLIILPPVKGEINDFPYHNA